MNKIISAAAGICAGLIYALPVYAQDSAIEPDLSDKLGAYLQPALIIMSAAAVVVIAIAVVSVIRRK